MDSESEVSWATSMLRMVEERLKSEAPDEHEKYTRLNNKGKLEYIRKHWHLLDVGFDKALLDQINAVLHPLLEKVVTEEINKEIYEHHIPKSVAAKHNMIEFRIIMQRYANYVKRRSLEEESRLSLPYYLMIVESVYTADVDLVIFLLAKSGTRYYRTKYDRSREYVALESLAALDSETLYNKLVFLRENGFSVISDVCDRYLRNSIAHMDFVALKDGSVAYERMRKKTIIPKHELEARIVRLISVCQCVSESLNDFYGRRYGFYQTQSK